ncbi:SDR family oxidoreductase [Myxococcota bacterium]|nr:SDR family oxidoreductase [Myxococcota bacterium]
MRIQDARAIVTGAASGMGRHFALSFARGGAQVVAADVNADALAQLQAEAQGLPGQLHTQLCNVASEDDVVRLVGAAHERMGGLNVLVNNAGIFRDGLLVRADRETGAIKKMSLDQWNAVIAVDLTGPFLCTREFAAKVIEAKAGPAVVVNVSSVSRHGNVGQSNYSAAKAGLVADTALWGKELARYGIRVGAIAPGFVDTPILQGMRPEVLQKMLQGVPLGRAGSTEEIWTGVRFIVECDFFTGRCIDIDGGMSV